MDVVAPDGRTWRVVRQRIAWRPRLPRWVAGWWSVAEAAAHPITGLVSVAIIIVLLPVLAWYVLGWLAGLVATPVVWLARTTRNGEWPVVARCDGRPPREYRGAAAGVRTAEALVDHVGMEIRRYGEPRSLVPARAPR